MAPATGAILYMFVLPLQIWVGPLILPGCGGAASLEIIISSNDGVQLPLEMVQRKVFIPIPIAVTPEVGDVGVVIVAVPEINVQTPAPMTGVFPASNVVLVQIFWSAPAFEAVGG